jgi:conjugal transfer pilus assembly protein TraB
VKAVVIGGADTSAGVDNQANPTPVLLRLINDGRAPNGHSTDLRNCRLTAAAIGSVSSERSQLRLERLSCTRDDGTVIERPVKGTVFGPSGHNGVRGRHVSRNQRMLYNAGVSGVLSGLGDSVAQQFSTISQSPLGATQTVKGEDVVGHSLAKGADTGMSKLADYYIKRAEQYHPVIELNAGTRVDVVFLKGFQLRHQPKKPTQSESSQQQTRSTTARGRAQQALADMNQSGREQP